MEAILQILFIVPSLLIGLTFHEFMHGYVAHKLGDPTPKAAGRLSLNPLRHLDPIGSIMLFIVHFGWAKPVPVNPVYMRNPKQDMMWVALAGPGANLIIAILFSFLLKATVTLVPETVTAMLYVTVQINIILALFNLIPFPPLDGSKVLARFLPDSMMEGFRKVEQLGFVLLILVIFVLGFSPLVILRPVIDLINRILGL